MTNREYENDEKKYEEDIKRITDGIDIPSLEALSVEDLKVRNAIMHKIVQEAILSNDPRKEALTMCQRAINAVLVNKIGKRGRDAKPVVVKLDKLALKLDRKNIGG